MVWKKWQSRTAALWNRWPPNGHPSFKFLRCFPCSASCLIFSHWLALALKKSSLRQRHAPGTSKDVHPGCSLSLGSQHLHAEGTGQETVQSPWCIWKVINKYSTFPEFLQHWPPLSLTSQRAVHPLPKEQLCVCWGGGLVVWLFCFVWVVWAYVLQVDGRFPEVKSPPCTSVSLTHSAELGIQFRMRENSLER